MRSTIENIASYLNYSSHASTREFRLIILLVASLLFAGCATSNTITSLDKGTPIRVDLHLPDGDGPFPAVVLMHGCGGTQEGLDGLRNHAKYLNEFGIAGLVVDSYSHRWVSARQSCRDSPLGLVQRRTLDAFAALKHLQQDDRIIDDAIGIQGASQGGKVALRAIGDTLLIDEYSPQPNFAAAIAFYPYCYSYDFQPPPSVPLLIIIGSQDDWTPAANCKAWVKKYSHRDPAPQIVLIDGAEHAFDLPDVSHGTYMGHTVGFSPQGYQQAQKHQRKFFLEHLK